MGEAAGAALVTEYRRLPPPRGTPIDEQGDVLMHMRYLAALALTGLLLPAGPAAAEPQILALLSTDGAMPLVCEGDECRAELSAFCMEPGRAGPPHASPYSLAAGEVTLIAHHGDGTTRRLDAAPYARFHSQHGYAAVRVSVPASLLTANGAESLALEVGRRVALLPVPLPTYHRPHKPEEVAAALGPNRILGDQLVDRGGEKADAARLLSYAINALPERGEAAPALRRQAWQAARREASERVSRQGQEIAEDVFESCTEAVAKSDLLTFRHCLQRGHDHTLWFLNHRYWQTVGPQS